MKFNGHQKSFTLIELLTVTGIIIIMTSIFVINYRTGESQFALQRSANKLAQDIRRAQEMAMSTKKCEICAGVVPPGYGIVLDKDWNIKKYRLYADTNGNNEFFNPADPADPIIQTIDLEKGVIVKEIFDTYSSAYSSVSINFKPPDPEVNIKFNIGPGEQLETMIIIALETNLNEIKTITINKAGLIYVE